jgi:hypothetical protein
MSIPDANVVCDVAEGGAGACPRLLHDRDERRPGLHPPQHRIHRTPGQSQHQPTRRGE